MSAVLPSTIPLNTLADVVQRVPDVPLSRIRLVPLPGTATEADVIGARDTERRLCELVDGVLVEKAVGTKESIIAQNLLAALHSFVKQRRLGIVTGEGGMLRLAEGLVRIPDGAFVSSDQFPEGVMPDEPVWGVHPDLALEVLSDSNTAAEMARKIQEYFDSGARLVWIVDPRSETVTIHAAANRSGAPAIFGRGDTLDGGEVLPGFAIAVAAIFDV